MVGFLKPVRDFVSTLVIYAITIGFEGIKHSTIQNDNFSFNIWVFLVFYIAISSLLELISDAIYNLKRGYKEPIDSTIRICGLIFGTGFFSFIFLPIYFNIGGDVSDAIISAFIAGFFSILGTAIRLHFINKRYYCN